MAKTKNQKYLETFFEEKEIKHEMLEIEHAGEIHMIHTNAIINMIMQAPKTEQETIANTLRKIDFVNGDVNHYLKFLAEAYIKTNY
jgi:penicillin-binding protein-related factor A (putative recombinase)